MHFEQLLDADRLRCPGVDYIELQRLLVGRTLDYPLILTRMQEKFCFTWAKYTGAHICA